MNKVDQEILEALAVKPEDIEPEEVMSEDFSPFNQPIAEKYIADECGFAPGSEPSPAFAGFPDDAPEQVIKGEAEPSSASSEKPHEPDLIPFTTAKIAADGLLGMVNNVLAVGGGFFVKIKKHKEFYDFEEVIQILDSQNEKNIRRIKLDEDDKTLLSPLLAMVIQKQAKAISPEQQLLAAALSILMKKTQAKESFEQEQAVMADLGLNELGELDETNPRADRAEEDRETIQFSEEITESFGSEMLAAEDCNSYQAETQDLGSSSDEAAAKKNNDELVNEETAEMANEQETVEVTGNAEVPAAEGRNNLMKQKNSELDEQE